MSLKALDRSLRAFERKYLTIPKEKAKKALILEALWICTSNLKIPAGLVGLWLAFKGLTEMLLILNIVLANWH